MSGRNVPDQEMPQSRNNVLLQNSLFFEFPEQEQGRRATRPQAKRKLQVANGYLLNFDNITRILSAVWENRSLNRIGRAVLVESTGLPNNHAQCLVSMASAMGLIQPIDARPTAFGSLVASNDMFFERQGTLEWCHYRGAGSMRNLVWFDTFNRIVHENEPQTHRQWSAWFRSELAGQYSDRTLQKVEREVRFVINAYLEQKLKTLEILELGEGDVIVQRRHRQIEHLIFAAMLYDFIEAQGCRTFEIAKLTRLPGSPALVFGLDADSMRSLVEALHAEGLARYETTHNLDQIRLIPGFRSEEFLSAYYEKRQPTRDNDPGVSRG